MVVIRVDANAKIASGHLMRCLSVAAALREAGSEVVFLTADETPRGAVEAGGFRCIVLHTRWDDMMGEIPAVNRVLREYRPECLLVDSYAATAPYFEALRGAGRIACLDDFAEVVYPVDLVVNYNISFYRFPYEALYQGRSARLLLGPSYAPLRGEFQGITPVEVKPALTDVLITTGGSDPFDITGGVLGAVRGNPAFQGATFHVVVGPYFEKYRDARGEDLPGGARAVFYQNVSRMSERMLACQAAVCSSGSTMYELCACGLPAVVFSFADNQTELRECFARAGAGLDAGDYRSAPAEFPARAAALLERLAPAEARRDMQRIMRGIVDGNGAARIAGALLDQGEQGEGG